MGVIEGYLLKGVKMKIRLALIMSVMFLCTTIPFAVEVRGTVTKNILFQDVDGTGYNLFDLLEEDRFFFLHMTHSK